MKLLLVNPNSTPTMTDTMAAAARSVLGPDCDLIAVTAPTGPESIEGYYDEAFSVPPMLGVLAAHRDDIDGAVIGCFDDTGVDAARCLLDVPVIGICQAAMQAATVLAGSFSVVTTLGRSVPALEHLAIRYGLERSCRRVRACEVPVLDLERSGSGAEQRVADEVERALNEDGAEAVVLGCAGMVELAGRLSERFGAPVIDGVTVAVKQVEALASIGLRTSSLGGYAPPREKLFRS